ncbi:MAG: hypothetical protein WAT37_19790 [Saprospiraceae bacterium]
MKRRKFIGVSGISLLGMNGIVNISSLLFQKENTNNLSCFIELIGAQKLNNKLSDKQIEYISKISNSWTNLGYKNNESGQIHKAGNILIYPMKLFKVHSDHIDEVVLIFTMLKNGDLKYTGSLSGFHLEIIEIHKNLILQLGDPDMIQSCILPGDGKGKPIEGGWAYYTKKGHFELGVKIETDKSYVSSALMVDEKFIWQNSILSNHTLHRQSPSLA